MGLNVSSLMSLNICRKICSDSKVSWNLTLLSNYGVYIWISQSFFVWVMNGIKLNWMKFNETEHFECFLLNFVCSALTWSTQHVLCYFGHIDVIFPKEKSKIMQCINTMQCNVQPASDCFDLPETLSLSMIFSECFMVSYVLRTDTYFPERPNF